MGYFYGFKLPIVINDKGGILSFAITQANVDGKEPLKNENFLKDVFGELFAYKGYISKELNKIHFVDGIHLITSVCNNMKNSLMDMCDKINLRKRSVVEIVNDELKNRCEVEHSRHISVGNFFTNLIGGLIAYSFFPKKPSINHNIIDTSQLQLFWLIELRFLVTGMNLKISFESTKKNTVGYIAQVWEGRFENQKCVATRLMNGDEIFHNALLRVFRREFGRKFETTKNIFKATKKEEEPDAYSPETKQKILTPGAYKVIIYER